MIKNIMVILAIHLAATTLVQAQTCSLEKHSDCEVVKKVTRCDVAKWKLNQKIKDLEKQLADSEGRNQMFRAHTNAMYLKIQQLEARDPVVINPTKVIRQTIVKQFVRKNRVYGLVGYGPTGIKATESTPTTFAAELDRGVIGGAGYMHMLDNSLSLGGQVQTNKFFGITLGKDF